jgi:hypothetical protein
MNSLCSSLIEILATLLILVVLSITWYPTFLIIAAQSSVINHESYVLAVLQSTIHIALACFITINLLRCKYFGESDRPDISHPIDFIQNLLSLRKPQSTEAKSNNQEQIQSNTNQISSDVYVDPLLPEFTALCTDQASNTTTNSLETVINDEQCESFDQIHLPFLFDGDFADDPLSPFNLSITLHQIQSITTIYQQIFQTQQQPKQKQKQKQQQKQPEQKQQNLPTPQESENNTLEQFQLANRQYDENKKQRLYRVCHKCDQIKSPRMHHCNRCGKCHLQYDHYCIFLNQCISYENKRSFYLFVFYVLLGCIWMGFFVDDFLTEKILPHFYIVFMRGTGVAPMLKSFSFPYLIYQHIARPAVVLCQFLIPPLLLFLTAITYLWIYKNTTTIEWLYQ